MSIITITLDPPNYKPAFDVNVYIAQALHSFTRMYEKRARSGKSLAFNQAWAIEQSSVGGATLTIKHTL